MVDGTESDLDPDSVEAPDDSEDTSTDTSELEDGRKPVSASATDDLELAIELLKSRQGEIPAGKLEFLDSKFQPEFNRRLNALNERERFLKAQEETVRNTVKTSLQEAFRQAGIGQEIPPGKDPLELLSEDGGKAFYRLLQDKVQEAVQPIQNQIAEVNSRESLKTAIQGAFQADSVVQENFKEAVAALDADSELQSWAMSSPQNMGYALRGMARELQIKKMEVKLSEMNKVIEKSKIATKVGTSTSKAGNAPKAQPSKAMSIRGIAEQKWDEVVSG